MFLDKKEGKNRGACVVGFDLGERFSQISYFPGGEDEPETVAVVAGTEQYGIPTVLCKRYGVNQWFYGREAVKKAGEGEGVLVSGLVGLARKGEEVEVDGEMLEPTALLSLFLKRSLSLLYGSIPAAKVEGIMFTVDGLDGRMVEVLGRAAEILRLKTKKVFFQSHRESLFHYMLRQPRELWTYQVLACDYGGDELKLRRMECNKHTDPVVVFIEEQSCDGMEMGELPEEGEERERLMKRLDHRFLEIVKKACGEGFVSSVYLLGEGFKEGWADDSLRFLCRNRRVFQGNNLYSKGACYAARERLEPSELSREYVYLGEDKLKSNVGMRVVRRGLDSYYALLDAGINWYEAKARCEVMLESGTAFSLMVTPLNGKEVTEVVVSLDNLEQRPERTTRLRLSLDMLSASKVRLVVEDLGFGEIFPSSGRTWTEGFNI